MELDKKIVALAKEAKAQGQQDAASVLFALAGSMQAGQVGQLWQHVRAFARKLRDNLLSQFN